MTQTGYSGTPLWKKLGINERSRIVLKNEPEEYFDWIAPIPAGVTFLSRLSKGIDIVHVFASRRAELTRQFPKMMESIHPDGMIWVSWHKKASKIPTEITEDGIREIALPLGLVDVKVCSVSDIYSGLKMVIRKELRND